MGCSKNLVDSERLMRQLTAAGYHVKHDPAQPSGTICVVNTCGFIGDAKEESINMILRQGKRKAEGQLQRLYVMGCLSQRYMDELKAELPEVDGWYGKFDWDRLLTHLGHAWDTTLVPDRVLTTPAHYAYLKISEGCDRHCGYCAIPIITGPHRSRPIAAIVAEVESLVAQGVKEFQVIAQELTYYGLDLYHRRAIAELVEAIANVSGVEWVRLHYAYPTDFPWELLDVMKRCHNVCHYLDVALQHVADPVLTAMRRHITKAETYAFVERLRREVPDMCLRTTLMVGHPGETDEAFAELLDFVRWARFDRMGAFAYSEEEGTPTAKAYADDIPDAVKQERLSRLMRVQQRISAEVQEAKVGSVQRVVIDRTEGEFYVGRTQYDSPEVDTEVLISIKDNDAMCIGEFYNVSITSADDFDLYGTFVANASGSVTTLK